MRRLPVEAVRDPNILVGFETGDDAAVYRLSDDVALVLTVDFFPPIVDDPFDYGAIAVANALSDVYAVGGRPITGLNIAAFPRDLPPEIIARVFEGGGVKAAEAGVVIIGGHTVDDKEPKYGLAVTGLITPGKQVTNAAARPGDQLVLTKAIGTGIITTAGKNDMVRPEVMAGAVQSMSLLNRGAAEAMTAVGVNAATDITGFGLLGHLKGMVVGSRVSAKVFRSAVPVLDGALDLLEGGVAPGGTHRNLEAVGDVVKWGEGITDTDRLLLCDAQTSGGMLISVPPERTHELQKRLLANGTPFAAVVGEVIEGDPGTIYVEA